jgi:hypothetical protein
MKTNRNFKTGLTLFVLALCFTLSGMQCEKVKFKTYKLPPATQNGSQTFGCLIDGEVFVPDKSWADPSLINKFIISS